MLEEDLFKPVSDFLVNAGYSVRSEVNHCDIMAVKGDELLAIELKKSMNLKLILQAVIRQRSADTVYVAIARPQASRNKKWKDLFLLIRRLELGLLFVDPEWKGGEVEVVIESLPFDRERSRSMYKKKRASVVAEMAGRLKDYNKGGSSKKKLVTAYKESCIRIASCLKVAGPLSTRRLRCLGTHPKKTQTMLYDNYYGWFERIEKGVYGLSKKGEKELSQYKDLARHYESLARRSIDSELMNK